jgi:hypothetical protein
VLVVINKDASVWLVILDSFYMNNIAGMEILHHNPFMSGVCFRKEQILISLLQLWAKSFQPWQKW